MRRKLSPRRKPGSSRSKVWIPAFAGMTAVIGCVTAPLKPPMPPPSVSVTRYTALVRLNPEETPAFEDDIDTASLRAAALQSLSYYHDLPQDQLFILGADTYTARDFTASIAALIHLLDSSKDRG